MSTPAPQSNFLTKLASATLFIGVLYYTFLALTFKIGFFILPLGGYLFGAGAIVLSPFYTILLAIILLVAISAPKKVPGRRIIFSVATLHALSLVAYFYEQNDLLEISGYIGFVFMICAWTKFRKII